MKDIFPIRVATPLGRVEFDDAKEFGEYLLDQEYDDYMVVGSDGWYEIVSGATRIGRGTTVDSAWESAVNKLVRPGGPVEPQDIEPLAPPGTRRRRCHK